MGYSSRDMIGIHEVKDPSLWRACIAEIFGTMMLTFVGCGSCTLLGNEADSQRGLVSVVQIALAFGITVATLAQTIGHISGCHINPAISVGLFAGGRMGVIKMGIYIACQCVGAVIGAFILNMVVAEGFQGMFGITTPFQTINGKSDFVPELSVSAFQAVVIEFLITMVLVLTVFGVTDEMRNDIKGSAALAIGLSITACHLFAAKFTGSSMNPARSLGPALIKCSAIPKGLQNLWIYLVGPTLGGAAAGLLYTFVFRSPGPDNRTAPTTASSSTIAEVS